MSALAKWLRTLQPQKGDSVTCLIDGCCVTKGQAYTVCVEGSTGDCPEDGWSVHVIDDDGDWTMLHSNEYQVQP